MAEDGEGDDLVLVGQQRLDRAHHDLGLGAGTGPAEQMEHSPTFTGCHPLVHLREGYAHRDVKGCPPC